MYIQRHTHPSNQFCINILVNVNICVHVAIHSTRPRQQFTHRRAATITMYDSVERGAADECEPLRGRRPRTFTLTQLLVACGAVCLCAIAATTAVNTHLVSTHEDYPEGAQLGLKGAPSASGCQANLEKAEIRLKKYEATLRDVEKMVESTVEPEPEPEPEPETADSRFQEQIARAEARATVEPEPDKQRTMIQKMFCP